MRFSHLHTHSHYSLLDGLPKIDHLLDYAKSLGMDALAITDHGVLYGAVEFYQKAKAKGIKPVIGEEFYLAFEKKEDRRANIDDKRYHLVLLAKNNQGYENLVKLTTEAWLKGFYYKPRIDEELLEKYSQGLICLSGCLRGKIHQLILKKRVDEAENLALKYQEIFGKNNFYLEIQHHPNLKEQQKVNEVLISFSKKLKIPLVATNDVHYLKSEDAEAQDILMLINTGAKLDDPERLTMKADNFSFYSQEKMKEFFKDTPEAIENTEKIVTLCNFEFKIGKINFPIFEIPDKKDPNEYLKRLCLEKLKTRYSKENKEILSRLKEELLVIKKTGFASYFLIVQDFVNWAKENKIIVGPGRGSVAGSLVSYLLGITEIDPLKYDLLFERFLTGERVVMPDIDLDFADLRRDEVIDYVAEKYGKDKVARIITFGTMAAKQVVRDVGRALGYPYSYCDRIAKAIPFSFNLNEALMKTKEFQQIYYTEEKAKKIIDIAKKLEGVARHASTHACGIVISNSPLVETVALQQASQNDKTIITQYDMYSIEALGFLKMDLLGLKNLTIIEEVLKLIKERKGIEIDISKLPLDDKETYHLLQKGETTGVFQIESQGCKYYLKELKPNTFEDIIVMIALYRPGPMELIPSYINYKHKRKEITYLHPKLKPILEKTFGICIFQEQLMKIAQELAGFSLTEADILRKAVGKKIKSLLVEQKEKLINGMIKNKIKKEIAEKIWDRILPFARYAFNKAHATAYAMITYQTAYLRAHFPIEFMAVLMNTEQKNIDRLKILLEEIRRMKIKVLPPDINESGKDFTIIDKNTIRFGLSAIKNVGYNFAEKIIEEKEKGEKYLSIEDFIERIPIEVLNKKSMESLIKTGVFDKFGERSKLLYNLPTLLEFARSLQRKKINGDGSLFGKKGGISLKLNNNLTSSKDNDKILWEKEFLGVFISSHPLLNLKEKIKNTLSINNLSYTFASQQVKIAGLISKIQKITTRIGQPMLFVTLEDLSGQIEILVFPDVFEKNPLIFQENKILEITGSVSHKDERLKIICKEAKEIG